MQGSEAALGLLPKDLWPIETVCRGGEVESLCVSFTILLGGPRFIPGLEGWLGREGDFVALACSE